MTVYLLAGGGTAGHVNPLLAVADRLRERDPGAEVLVLGTAEGLEARLVPGARLRAPHDREGAVPAAPEPRGAARSRRGSARRSPTCRAIIDERGVDVVVGFGGYVSTPAYLAARRARHPGRDPRGERQARAREPARRTLDRGASASRSTARRCRTPRSSACRCAARSRQLDRAALRDEARALLRARRRPARCCS